MTHDKVMEVLTYYNQLLGFHTPVRDGTCPLCHCRWMIDEMRGWTDSPPRLGKMFRWLGFIQGVLWTSRVCSIEQLKEHNQPTDRME